MKNMLLFLIINLVSISIAYGEDVIVEENGVISIVGNPTVSERAEYLTHYRQRMVKREQIVNAEIKRAHEIEIETLKAQALTDYLNAQALVYGNNTKPVDKTSIYVRGSKANATISSSINNDNTNETTNNNTTNNDNTNSNTNDNRNAITIK